MKRYVELSAYKMSRCLISGDFPNDTKEAKTASRRFIREAIKLGFNGFRPGHSWGVHIAPRMWFLSMTCSLERAKRELLPLLPADGELRIFGVTEKQVEKMCNHWGRIRKAD